MKARVVFISVSAILVVLGFVSYSGLLAGPPGKGTASKGGRKITDAMTSVKEREAMGIDPATWTQEHGKVQPDVRKELEDEKKLDEYSIDVMYKPGRPVGFLHMVYVVVHLQVEQGKSKEETRVAIQGVQTSVLRKLTAVEFSDWFRFKDHPAVLGYVNEAGLAKLTKDKNVVAIGLDTRPFAISPVKFHSQGPKEEMDSELPKVSTQVRAALGKVNYVKVVVILKRDGVQGLKSRDENQQVLKVEDWVLSRLTAEEFRTTSRFGLHGWVNAAGVIKLSKDPDVVAVGLPGPPMKLPAFKGSRP